MIRFFSHQWKSTNRSFLHSNENILSNEMSSVLRLDPNLIMSEEWTQYWPYCIFSLLLIRVEMRLMWHCWKEVSTFLSRKRTKTKILKMKNLIRIANSSPNEKENVLWWSNENKSDFDSWKENEKLIFI